MENKNENNTSIIPFVLTTLVKTTNSIAITNKILNERNPNQKLLLLTKAIELINEKKYKEAILVLDELIFLDSLNNHAYFQRGISHYELKMFDNAINDFSKVISIEPDNANAYFKLAEVFLNGNRAGKINVTDSTSFFGNTKLEYYQTAIQYCNKAIELEPNHREAYFIKGMCNYYSKENQEAVMDFDKAIELDPNKSDAYIQRGFAKMHNNDYLGVLFDENKLKELIPNFSFKKYGYPDIKQIIQSLEKYSNEIINNPSDSNAFRNRGAIKFNAGDYQGAFDDISKAIYFNPMDSLAYCFRGLILQNPNWNIDKTKALEDLTTAISISPDIGFYYLERAELKNSLRDIQGVLEDCSIALSIDNSLARAYIFRGWAKENLYGLKYEENEDIHQYEKLTGEDMSGFLAGVNGNKKLYAI
jgi:tetratricopeptide (TPR) repeat protein